jgi:hypothetical protein
MATTTSRYTLPSNGSDLARRTALGTLTAVLAVLLARALVGAAGLDLGTVGANDPFATVPLVTSSVVAGAGAAVAYAALARYTDCPVRNFGVVAAVVFAAMLLPVFLVAPSLGVSATGQAVLVVLHALVAGPIVAFVVGAARL